jgi:hypothetical protein
LPANQFNADLKMVEKINGLAAFNFEIIDDDPMFQKEQNQNIWRNHTMVKSEREIMHTLDLNWNDLWVMLKGSQSNE